MSDTPTSFTGSWVDLSGELSSGAVSPIIPLGGDSHFIRMLKEAQGETSGHTSWRSSCKVSPFMSHNSPRSPPNSPNNGRVDSNETDLGLTDVYINTISDKDVGISDFIWDWSSRPNIIPPKQWKLSSKPSQKSFKVFSTAKSKDNFMFTVVITNILSLIIGAGIGVWVFRNRSASSI